MAFQIECRHFWYQGVVQNEDKIYFFLYFMQLKTFIGPTDF